MAFTRTITRNPQGYACGGETLSPHDQCYAIIPIFNCGYRGTIAFQKSIQASDLMPIPYSEYAKLENCRSKHLNPKTSMLLKNSTKHFLNSIIQMNVMHLSKQFSSGSECMPLYRERCIVQKHTRNSSTRYNIFGKANAVSGMKVKKIMSQWNHNSLRVEYI